ncbi:hypothetical protein [Halomicrococcus sp. NG-SE-24]|uniref:hypothetical protein n=1 Tax=Halomicrococcus sp. NG-SE-24 TaxID=3436928 RepID=UPI003D9694A3
MTRRVTLAGVVAVHLLVNLAHGAVHAAVPVALSSGQWAFVALVVVLAPVAGVAFARLGDDVAGAAVVALSLVASLAFGLFVHFAVPNPDHVRAVGGVWSESFSATAALIAAVDGVGALVCGWVALSEAGQ